MTCEICGKKGKPEKFRQTRYRNRVVCNACVYVDSKKYLARTEKEIDAIHSAAMLAKFPVKIFSKKEIKAYQTQHCAGGF